MPYSAVLPPASWTIPVVRINICWDGVSFRDGFRGAQAPSGVVSRDLQAVFLSIKDPSPACLGYRCAQSSISRHLV